MSLDKIYLPRTELPIVHLAERQRDLQHEIAIFPGADCTHLPTVAALAERIGWTDTAATFAELDASLSLDQLDAPDDVVPTQRPYDPAAQLSHPVQLSRLDVPTRAASTLRTLAGQVAAMRRDNLKKKTSQLQQRCCFSVNNRYVTVPRTPVMGADEPAGTTASASSSTAEALLMEPGSELLVVVRIYQPFTYVPSSTARMRLRLHQRITVLGSQTLAELRDRIDCECTRNGPYVDISQRPQPTPADEDGDEEEADDVTSSRRSQKPPATKRKANNNRSKTKPPAQSPPFAATAAALNDPGFFFITDTFYTDTRHACAADYTAPIREWAALHPDEVGPLRPDALPMDATRLDDLHVRLGAPQVYQHAGNCEHVFCVSDVRLLGGGDARRRADYPLVDVVAQRRWKACGTCAEAKASVMVRDSVWHVDDPTYLCDECFRSLHYVDGRKVGEFRAYAFVGHLGVEKASGVAETRD